MGLPFTPDISDGGVQLLQMIFGDAITRLVNSTAASTDTAATLMGTAFALFNSGVLFFGALILAFVTVFGITNSANDGEVLGSKWSTFYTPLRTLSASALLIPTTSGFSGVQIFVMMVAIYSCGFANNIWRGVVEYALVDDVANKAVSSVMENQKFSELMVDALRMQVCAQGVNNSLSAVLGSSAPAPLQLYAPQYNKQVAGKNVEFIRIYYASPNWPNSENICGTIAFTNAVPLAVEAIQNAAAGVGNALTGNVFRENSQAVQDTEAHVYQAVTAIRKRYMLALFDLGGGSPVAATRDQIITAAMSQDGSGTVDSDALRSTIAQYNTQLLTEVRAAVRQELAGDTAQLTSQLTSGGWIFAGVWQRELARVKDAVRTASSVQYDYIASSGLNSVMTGPVYQAVSASMSQYDYITAPLIRKAVYSAENGARTSSATPKIIPLRTNFDAAEFGADGKNIKEYISSYFNYALGEQLLTHMVTYLGANGADPVMQIKDLGDAMATIAEAVILGKAVLGSTLTSALEAAKAGTSNVITGTLTLGAGTALVSILSAITSILAELWSMVSMPITTLLYLGYFMGIWIPMIPFFIFSIGVAGWVLAVIEAVIASSLWAVMHLTPPSGNDTFIGSQGQGYLLLASVFFRPALMILGLVVSMAAIIPLLQFMNWSFVLSFRVIQTNSATGLFSIAGFMLAYVFVIFSFLMLMFGLPQTLPDRVLKWVGAGIGDLGEQSTMGKIESGASGQARMAAVAMGQKAAGKRQQDIAAADRKLQTEQNQYLRDIGESIKGHEPEGIGDQGVAPRGRGSTE